VTEQIIDQKKDLILREKKCGALKLHQAWHPGGLSRKNDIFLKGVVFSIDKNFLMGDTFTG